MIRINYITQDENQNKNDTAIYNIIISDKFKKTECIDLSSIGWLKNNLDKNYQDLEKLFRELNLNSYVIAKTINDIPSNIEIIMPNNNSKNELKYVASIFCGSYENFIEELKKHHDSYDGNFACLSNSGCLMHKNSSIEKNIEQNISSNLEAENIKKIVNAEAKYEMTLFTTLESVQILKDDLIKKNNKEPTISVCGDLHGKHVFAFTYNGEIASPIGWVEYEGEYILIDFRKINNKQKI
jgi:hypothetical protein